MTAVESHSQPLIKRFFWLFCGAYVCAVLAYGFTFAFSPGFGQTVWFSISSAVLALGLYVVLVAGGKVPGPEFRFGSFTIDRHLAIGVLIVSLALIL